MLEVEAVAGIILMVVAPLVVREVVEPLMPHLVLFLMPAEDLLMVVIMEPKELMDLVVEEVLDNRAALIIHTLVDQVVVEE
jgi:hypothetical protein